MEANSNANWLLRFSDSLQSDYNDIFHRYDAVAQCTVVAACGNIRIWLPRHRTHLKPKKWLIFWRHRLKTDRCCFSARLRHWVLMTISSLFLIFTLQTIISQLLVVLGRKWDTHWMWRSAANLLKNMILLRESSSFSWLLVHWWRIAQHLMMSQVWGFQI